jgi:hypothetical protein
VETPLRAGSDQNSSSDTRSKVELAFAHTLLKLKGILKFRKNDISHKWSVGSPFSCFTKLQTASCHIAIFAGPMATPLAEMTYTPLSRTQFPPSTSSASFRGQCRFTVLIQILYFE